ncbi:sec-independent protein translocase protein TatA [Actinomadura pelletieri DSM 43383]|uniref:Sec-independent protein translocase protein TatA n=1 Tax=Actinomadura pelletieri DSM 43383 TaxID=1120940 RepID=A0A495QLF3_9ACTN|nr:Sec-independent protein translocase subunit TatA [Actinomadura pelletieri]RKS73407.1 sec-independent protein translocase protein TatA [Actinomadura pelletieri DSM 43383]
MAGLSSTEILIILAVVLLLFGSAKLPTLARSLGKSARILKAETKGLRDDDDPESGKDKAVASERGAQARDDVRDGEDGAQRPRGALGAGEPIQGVPVSDPGQVRKSG